MDFRLLQWIKSCLHLPFYERSHIPVCQLKSLRSLKMAILSQNISGLKGERRSRDLMWNTTGLSVVDVAFRQRLEQQTRQASQGTCLKIALGSN